jgi:glycine/D-amino acid oxidase-like deaminating enzyme
MNGSTAGSPDVVVVGGGIVGAATAAFLAEGGARVMLVEREGLASGASGANSGIVQHPFDPVLAGLYRATVELYRDLASRAAGFPFPADPTGMLFVSARQEIARSQARVISDTFPELPVDVLGGEELVRLEPALAPGTWACWAGIGFPVAPGASTYAYATLAESRGVEIRQGRSAALACDGDDVIGVHLGDRLIPAGTVVAAAGPWTPELIDPTGAWRPISPVWGVVVEAELARPPRLILEEAGIESTIGVPEGVSLEAPAGDAAPVRPDVDAVDFSLVPLPGASVVGSTFLHHEPNQRAWVEPILTRASRYVPGVEDAPIRGYRACARPLSADGRPLIGPVPWLRRLYVCAGHGPWGISTGPGSARLIADLVLGGSPAIPPELSPARFGSPRR